MRLICCCIDGSHCSYIDFITLHNRVLSMDCRSHQVFFLYCTTSSEYNVFGFIHVPLIACFMTKNNPPIHLQVVRHEKNLWNCACKHIQVMSLAVLSGYPFYHPEAAPILFNCCLPFLCWRNPRSLHQENVLCCVLHRDDGFQNPNINDSVCGMAWHTRNYRIICDVKRSSFGVAAIVAAICPHGIISVCNLGRRTWESHNVTWDREVWLPQLLDVLV